MNQNKKKEFIRDTKKLENGALQDLNVDIIAYFINTYGVSLGLLSEKMGWSESTIRKRLEGSYYKSKQFNKWIPLEYKEDMEFSKIGYVTEYFNKVNMLVMERYKDNDYWEERGYSCVHEKGVKEEIGLIKFLSDELQEEAEEKGLSKSQLIELKLLEHYKNRKPKNNGLKFEAYTDEEILEIVEKEGVNSFYNMPAFKVKKIRKTRKD